MIDISKFPASYRTRLIRLGSRYGSDDVLAQGRYIADRYKKPGGSALAAYGYCPADVATLEWACKELSDAKGARRKRRTNQRTARVDVATSEAEARLSRRIARTVLGKVMTRLLQDGNTDAASKVEIVMAETSRSPGAEDLSHQLGQIDGAFCDPAVKSVADESCSHAHERVKEALLQYGDAHTHRPRRTGTPAATERMDLLDGLIIENVRLAQRAAADAAIDLGKPHLAEAFRLYELEGRPRPASASSETELVPADVSDELDADNADEDVSNI